MKHRFFACLTAVLCSTAALAAPAAAEDNSVFPEIIVIEPLYDDFDPVGDDIIGISGLVNEPFSVQIIQHSPERDNLLLYDNDFEAQSKPIYFYRIEPGDYTIRITADAIAASAAKRTFVYDFTIENADYSIEPDIFTRTQYGFQLQLEWISGNDTADPLLTDVQTDIRVDSKVVMNTVQFGRYARFRGDFDGDGLTDAADAQQTLVEYLETAVGGGTASATAEQIAACDIDGDGALTAADAQQILAFYLGQVIGDDPVWQDGIRDARYLDESV